MNFLQEKTFALLKDFDKICKDNQLTYFLSPQLARSARRFGGFQGNDALIDVYMPIEDGLSFIRIFEAMDVKDRSIEYMGNSPYYPSFSISFVDENSTYLNIKRGPDYSHCGIRIKIQFIRNNVKSRLCSALEIGWENNGYKLFKRKNKKNIISFTVVRALILLFGRKRVAKWLFNYIAKTYSSDKTKNGKKVFRTFKNQKKFFRKSIFKRTRLIEFEGEMFPVPAATIKYIRAFRKRETKLDRVKTNFTKSNMIVLENVPYKEYFKRLEEKGVDLKALFKENRRLEIEDSFHQDKLKAKDNAWIVACRSRDRLEFYEEFQAKKELIQNLYENEDFEELNRIFARHEQKTKYYLKKGLGFCVSQEIFDLQCELFLRRGMKRRVEKMRQLVPEEHRKPIID